MTDVDRVTCAIFLLTHRARTWWDSIKVSLRLEQMTWDQFKTTFFNKYFSKDMRAKKARDLLDLRQGNMTMIEYIQKFEEGCPYVPFIAQHDSDKGEHFMRGLRPEIKRDVRMSKASEYCDIVDRALMAEQNEHEIMKAIQQRRQQQFISRGQGKKGEGRGRGDSQQPKAPMVSTTKEKPLCPTCQKCHSGECFMGTAICFRCKKPGHFARNCPGSGDARPSDKKGQGRLYSMTMDETNSDTI